MVNQGYVEKGEMPKYPNQSDFSIITQINYATLIEWVRLFRYNSRGKSSRYERESRIKQLDSGNHPGKISNLFVCYR